MKKSKTIITGVVWTIIQNIVSILYGIVSVPFLINYFGKEEYGLIGLAISINVYVQLLDMGMTNSNIKFFSEFIEKKENRKVQSLFSLSTFLYVLIGIINTIVLFGFSFFTESFFKVDPDQAIVLRNLLWILALNATFSWISTCFDEFIRANELVSWIKLRITLLKCLQFVVLLSTMIFHFSIELYFLLFTFTSTMILPWSMVKAKEIMPSLKVKPAFNKEIFKQVFAYAVGVFSFGIFQFLAFNFRPLFLGNISGPGAVAEFSVMMTIASVVTLLSSSFLQVLLPTVTRMVVSNDRKGVEFIACKGTKYVTILITLVIAVLIVNMNDLILLYVGNQFLQISNWMIIWLLTLLLSHRNVMSSFVFTQNTLTSVAIMGAVAMIVAIMSYILFIPRYAVGGVVIGFTLHEIIHTLFYYLYFMPKYLKLNTYLIFRESVLPIWLCFAILITMFFLFSSYIHMQSLIKITITSVIFTIVYIFSVWKVVLKNDDKKLIYNLLYNRKK